jgi:hypothetical protein
MGIATDPAIGAAVGPASTAIVSSRLDGVFQPGAISFLGGSIARACLSC